MVVVRLELAVATAVAFAVPVGLDSENGVACCAGAAAFNQALVACSGPAGDAVVVHDCNEIRMTHSNVRPTIKIMSLIRGRFYKKGFAIPVFVANVGDSRSGMLPCRLFAFRAPVLAVADTAWLTGHRDRLF